MNKFLDAVVGIFKGMIAPWGILFCIAAGIYVFSSGWNLVGEETISCYDCGTAIPKNTAAYFDPNFLCGACYVKATERTDLTYEDGYTFGYIHGKLHILEDEILLKQVYENYKGTPLGDLIEQEYYSESYAGRYPDAESPPSEIWYP